MRIFTLEEANALVDRVRPMIDEVWERRRDLAIALLEREMCPASASAREDAARLRDEIVRIVERIEHLGCIVKDINLGLVDFPSTHGGRTVFLCWRVGEPEIAYWHDLDAGYAGRKSLK